MFDLECTSTVMTFIPPGFHLFLFHPSTHIAPRLNKLTVPSPSPIFTPLRTCDTRDQRLGRTTMIQAYLGIFRLVRVLVVDAAGFVQRQVKRGPSDFALRIPRARRWFCIHQCVFVLVFSVRVPTCRGQETTYHRAFWITIPIRTLGEGNYVSATSCLPCEETNLRILPMTVHAEELHRRSVWEPDFQWV